jgi:hypothetical protein
VIRLHNKVVVFNAPEPPSNSVIHTRDEFVGWEEEDGSTAASLPLIRDVATNTPPVHAPACASAHVVRPSLPRIKSMVQRLAVETKGDGWRRV